MLTSTIGYPPDHISAETCISDHGGAQACSVEIASLGSNPSQAMVQFQELGMGAAAVRFRGGAHEGRRTPRSIARSTVEYIVLLMHDGPPGVIDQGGRQKVIRPGELTIYDWTQPSAVRFPGTIRSNVLHIERSTIDVGSSRLADLAARVVPTTRGTAALLRSLLLDLAPRIADCSPAAAYRVGACVVDLAALLLREVLDDPTPTASTQRTLLTRIMLYIDLHLHDPDLCPGRIAAEHHISVRYLSKLFATEQLTVMTWVRERRLEKCRIDLADPRMESRSIANIAARWGLLVPAHFSRAFRARYGVSPREYRSAAAIVDNAMDGPNRRWGSTMW